MDFEEIFKHMSTYWDIYRFVGMEQVNLDDIKFFLMEECDKAESTARSYINMLKDDNINGLFVYDESENAVEVSEWMLSELLRGLDERFGICAYDPVVEKHEKAMEDLENYKVKNAKLEKLLGEEQDYAYELEQKYTSKQQTLESQLSKAEEMLYTMSSSQKVLVLSNVDIGPAEVGFYQDDQFVFKDRHPTIDERMMTLEPYLKEIKKGDGDQNSNEDRKLSALTLRFYQMRHVFSEKIRETLLQNMGPFRERYFHHHPQYQGLSISKLLEMKDMTNTERLSLYVMFADNMPEEKRQLIECAAEEGLDADLVIRILEDNAVSKDTKERFWSVLKMIKSDSEYQQRMRFARELLEQKWYILADYGGMGQEFKLVPVEEINHLHSQMKQLIQEKNTETLVTRESMRKEDGDNEQ